MHPVLFKVPLLGLEVYSYGVLLGVSLLAGWFLTHYWSRKEGLPRETVADTFVLAALGGLLGARLLYVAIDYEEFRNPLHVIQLNHGGLMAWGGLLGGALVSWIFLRRKNVCALPWFDAAAPSVLLGMALLGLGSFLHGSDFGRQSDTLSWAVQFPAGTPAFEWHDHLYGLASQGLEWSRPVQPVQLYAVVVGLVLFGVVILARRYRTFAGQIFLLAAIAYSAATYTLEIFRGDPKRGWLWMWSVSQVISVAVILAALVGYGLLWRRYRRDPSKAFDLGQGIQAAIDADRKSRDE
ncbi:MAG: prolipoprotein diacylglyceryl transferase [Deltaproteobacteria bacterium]|nr:prolipoprotein diacylglyceryl transferase [Deltaproteobacteria bacterium]